MTNTCDIMGSRKESFKLFNPFNLWTVASYVYPLKDRLLLFFPFFLILKVRGSSEESYKLDKPHSELMRYDVHPNALTQSGNYHFSGKNKFVMTQPLSGWLCCQSASLVDSNTNYMYLGLACMAGAYQCWIFFYIKRIRVIRKYASSSFLPSCACKISPFT